MMKNIYEIETGEYGDLKYWNAKGYGYDMIKASVRSDKATRKLKKLESHVFRVKEKVEPIHSHNTGHKGELNGFYGKHHTEETKEKIRATKKSRGVKALLRRELVVPEGCIALCDVNRSRSSLESICNQENVQVFQANYKNQIVKYIGKEDLVKVLNHSRKNPSETSKWEKDFQSHFPGAVLNTRSVIKPLELDLYFPEAKVAVECDGLYTHNELTKDRLYHLRKTELCKEKGIRLIHIFEDEWKEKKEICLSIINSALGRYERRIYARNCTVEAVEGAVAKEFLKKNHIQGDCNFSYAKGLFFEGELVQLVALRKNVFERSEKSLELARMCSSLNTQVVGGFSKLTKGLELTSYVDLRLFDGQGYRNSGWKIVSQTSPSYFYTDFTHRYNRMNYTKQNCLKRGFKGNTEHEMCNNAGLYRIFDCGCLKLKLI